MSTREERWERAFRRAQEQQVRPIRLGPGRYLVPSVSRPGCAYVVRVFGSGRSACSCPAGFWGHACKHQAASLLLERAPSTAAAVVPLAALHAWLCPPPAQPTEYGAPRVGILRL